MHPLIQEAIRITEDLGDVVFIGAVGIFLQRRPGNLTIWILQ
jgi:hypothetical protein